MSAVSLLRRWGLRLGGVVGAQGIVQLCNAAAGLLVVRFLPRESAYAWFTVASSMLIMVTLFADLGLSAALQAVGGPLWEDRRRFSSVVAALRNWQRWTTLVAVLMVVPWMLVLLHRLHAPLWSLVGASAMLMAFAWPSAAGILLSHVNRLHSRLRPQVMAELSSAFARLVLTAVSVGLGCWLLGGTLASVPVGAFLAVLAAPVLAGWLLYALVRREASRLLDENAGSSHEFDARIRGIVAGSMAFTLYYGLQGQVSTWLISLQGASAQVADVGALSRLGVLFSLATAPVVQVATPAFARCRDRDKLRRQLLLTCGLFVLFSGGVLLLVTLLPGPLLWLLGPQYAHLAMELRLAALVPAVTGLCGITWGLVMARGWIKSSALVVPAGIAAQVAGVFLFDLTTVSGVLLFNLFILLPLLLLACLVIWRGFRRWKVEMEKQKGEMTEPE